MAQRKTYELPDICGGGDFGNENECFYSVSCLD